MPAARSVSRGLGGIVRDFNAAALWAGLAAFIWYAFGAIPLHLAVARQLGLSAAQSSSWIFIIWFSGAVSSITLSLYYRQPLPITWTVPGLIYLGTLSGHYTFAELVGASMLAGVVILILALLGIGARLIAWLPLSIVLGMFAGSILGYITRLVRATVDDFFVAGSTVAGYVVGRMVRSQRVPPMGLAVVFGGVASFFLRRGDFASLTWSLPALAVPEMSFSMPAFVAVSLPLVVLSMGMGNVQGLGFLIAQGYRVPVNPVSVVVGINSIVNAMLGGHPATVARTGAAILASSDAGPLAGRYWANLVVATLTLTIALGAGTVASLLGVLPRSFAVALAGLAILSTFQDALVRAFSGELRFGALVGFAIAVTPFVFVGITSAFWAIIAGLAASLLVERDELIAYWKREGSA